MDEHILRSRATGKSQRRDWEPREKGNEQEGSGPAEPVKPGHPPWGPWLVPEGGEHVSVEIVGVSFRHDLLRRGRWRLQRTQRGHTEARREGLR